MRPRTLLFVLSGVLFMTALVIGQRFQSTNPVGQPPRAAKVLMQADGSRTTGAETTMTGNVVIEVNGVTVVADRAVVKDGEYRLEGNVRLRVPTR